MYAILMTEVKELVRDRNGNTALVERKEFAEKCMAIVQKAHPDLKMKVVELVPAA